MLKNMLLASAAAFVVLGSAASLTNMKAVITSGNGADAALSRDAFDMNAQLRELHAEQVRQATLLSVQQTTMRQLQRDLARAEKMVVSLPENQEGEPETTWTIGLDLPSPARATQAAEYHAAWLQAISLGDELAVAQNAIRELESTTGAQLSALEQESAARIETIEKEHGFVVARLHAEIEQRDSSIVGLMHRIVSQQPGGVSAAPAKPAAGATPAMPLSDAASADGRGARLDALPSAVTEPATAKVAERAAPTEAGGMASTATVADGVAAYRAGDYRGAFEVWRVLANSGSTQARFHLGALYFEGRGVAQQLETAHLLLGLAAEGGHEGAAALRDRVAAEMAKSQVAIAPNAAAH